MSRVIRAVAVLNVICLLGVIAALLGGCDAAPTPVSTDRNLPRPAKLADTTWEIAAAQGIVVPPGRQDVVWFNESSVFGATGCNQFKASLTYKPATGAIAFGPPIATTKIACDPDRTALERAFVQALAGATTASVDPAGHLILDGSGGTIVLVPSDRPRPTD